MHHDTSDCAVCAPRYGLTREECYELLGIQPQPPIVRMTVLPNFPGYGICEDGTIIGPSGRPMVGDVDRDGYRKFRPMVAGRRVITRVHRVVALAWLPYPPTPAHVQVAHGDGQPHNNHASNLRWSTQAENEQDKKRHGTWGRNQFSEVRDVQ